MITLNAFCSLPPPQWPPPCLRARPFSFPSKPCYFIPAKGSLLLPINAVTEGKGIVPAETDVDPDGGIVGSGDRDGDEGSGLSKIEGFKDWVFSLNSPDRVINAAIVLGAGSFAITKLLTIDRDYWHGWTFYEVLRYAPEHNWLAYEEALKEHPVLSKMAISGIVYSLGYWIAQCYEGRPLFEFDRKRVFRSGLVGFTLHGSLSHYYYQLCESLFPLKEWWVVLAKVALDQTVWSGVWNSIYFMLLGFLRFKSADNIFDELKSTFWPMLMAGWKLWPFAHLITYGVIPVEQRLLWVDCVELIWVTILSSYSNEKKEVQISEVSDAKLHSLPEESKGESN